MNPFFTLARAMLARLTPELDCYQIPASDIRVLKSDGTGWLAYAYVCLGQIEWRMIAPHYDPELASVCNADHGEKDAHDFQGVWRPDGLSLNCKVCGCDGT